MTCISFPNKRGSTLIDFQTQKVLKTYLRSFVAECNFMLEDTCETDNQDRQLSHTKIVFGDVFQIMSAKFRKLMSTEIFRKSFEKTLNVGLVQQSVRRLTILMVSWRSYENYALDVMIPYKFQ